MKLILGFTADDVKHWAMEEVANLKAFRDTGDCKVSFPHGFTDNTVVVEVSIPSGLPSKLDEIVRFKVDEIKDWKSILSMRGRRLIHHLNITTLQELYEVAREGGLQGHKGFGEKTIHELLKFIAEFEPEEKKGSPVLAFDDDDDFC